MGSLRMYSFVSLFRRVRIYYQIYHVNTDTLPRVNRLSCRPNDAQLSAWDANSFINRDKGVSSSANFLWDFYKWKDLSRHEWAAAFYHCHCECDVRVNIQTDVSKHPLSLSLSLLKVRLDAFKFSKVRGWLLNCLESGLNLDESSALRSSQVCYVPCNIKFWSDIQATSCVASTWYMSEYILHLKRMAWTVQCCNTVD